MRIARRLDWLDSAQQLTAELPLVWQYKAKQTVMRCLANGVSRHACQFLRADDGPDPKRTAQLQKPVEPGQRLAPARDVDELVDVEPGRAITQDVREPAFEFGCVQDRRLPDLQALPR
ncbi:MAG: hypothetical protein IRY83_15270 [Chloroflexi bacterium]|nr:hypothetical protein [Chloroflexota bacterium]